MLLTQCTQGITISKLMSPLAPMHQTNMYDVVNVANKSMLYPPSQMEILDMLSPELADFTSIS